MPRKPLRNAQQKARRPKGESQAEQGVRSAQSALAQIIAKADPASAKQGR